jgi:hypothetical protein
MKNSRKDKVQDLCDVFHLHAGCRCIRRRGMRVYVGAKRRTMGGGSITRCEWYSEGGKFKRHHQYGGIYAKNARGGKL